MSRRVEEEVDVLGHEDERDEPKAVTGDGPVDALREHPSPPFVGQQGHTAVAREGQLVAVAGSVDAADGLVLRRHDGDRIGESTGGQATSATRPPGSDEARIRAVIDHYEAQDEDERAAEIEAAWEAEGMTLMSVPTELVPEIRAILARKQTA